MPPLITIILNGIIILLSVGGLIALAFGVQYLPTLYREYIAQPAGETDPPEQGWDTQYQHYAIINDVKERSNGIIDLTFAPANNSGAFQKSFRTKQPRKGTSYPPLDILAEDGQSPAELEGHAFAAEFRDGDWVLLDVERYERTKAPVTSPTLLNRVATTDERDETAQLLDDQYQFMAGSFFTTGAVCAIALGFAPAVLIGGFGGLLLTAVLLLLLPVTGLGLYPFWLATQDRLLQQLTRMGRLPRVLTFNDITVGTTVSFTNLDGTYTVIDIQPESNVFVVQATDDDLLITPIRFFEDPVDRPRYTCYTPFADDDKIDGIGYCYANEERTTAD